MTDQSTRRRPGMPITPGMQRRAAELYNGKFTLRSIAKELGCSPTSAAKAAVAGGATIRNPGPIPTPVPPAAVAAIVARHERDAASVAAIADDLNQRNVAGWPVLTSAIVRRVLRDAEVPPHRPCRRPATKEVPGGLV